MNYVDPKLQARRTQIVEVLEMVCESLELSNSQFAQVSATAIPASTAVRANTFYGSNR